MAQRQTEEQAVHDLVIQAAAEQFASSAKYSIYTNPGIEKRAGIGNHYPDILVMDKGSSKVRYILEVETIDSIDATEVKEWREFASLGPPLYVVVPHVSLQLVQRLCAAFGVKCRFGYFHRESTGLLRVVLMKEDAAAPAAPSADLRAKFAALKDRGGQ